MNTAQSTREPASAPATIQAVAARCSPAGAFLQSHEHQGGAQGTATLPSWRHCYLCGHLWDVVKEADELGAKGWEMVSVVSDADSPSQVVAFMKLKGQKV